MSMGCETHRHHLSSRWKEKAPKSPQNVTVIQNGKSLYQSLLQVGGGKIKSVPRLEQTSDKSEKKEGVGNNTPSTGATAPCIPAGISGTPESAELAARGFSKLAMKKKRDF